MRFVSFLKKHSTKACIYCKVKRRVIMATLLEFVDFESSDEDNISYEFWTGSMFVKIDINLGYFIRVSSTGRTPFYAIVDLMEKKEKIESISFLKHLQSGDYLNKIAINMYKDILIYRLSPVNNLPC